MWAANDIGEGVNLAYNFMGQKNYCMEATFYFTNGNDNKINPDAKTNIYLTDTQVFGGTAIGASFPPVPAQNQLIYQENFTNLVLN